jgi:hypothetical protein
MAALVEANVAVTCFGEPVDNLVPEPQICAEGICKHDRCPVRVAVFPPVNVRICEPRDVHQ